jgi:lipopolysaccharide/colanic/teichoic acid biosynthesis glycosyltransferase
MSVVGPRAAWTDEELHLEQSTNSWRKRWFVRPGLTGLAQVNDATSTVPKEKLRYDLNYIRKQSFWFDLKILVRQLWMVGIDAVRFVK